MALTITTLINAVSVGTTPSPSSNLTKWTLAATTEFFSLQALLVNNGPRTVSDVVVYYAASPDNLTLTTVEVATLMRTAQEIRLPQLAAGESVRLSIRTERPRGGYVYLWVNEPKLAVAATLTVKGSEYP